MGIGAVVATVLAIGEPVDGFPSWSERVGLVYVNRARADPTTDLAGCTVCADKACYKAVPPLGYDRGLNRSARFHSANLRLSGKFAHESPCTLVSDISAQYTPGPCNGDPSCACVGGSATCSGACTSPQARIGYFGSGGLGVGENIAWSYTDPVATFYQWFWEDESSETCGGGTTNGHRRNIVAPGYNRIGVGNDGDHWTHDLNGGGTTPSGIVAGAHTPKSGSTIAFRANWYGSKPTVARVNVDGTCTALALERGSDTNGTFLGSASVSGCQHYVFEFESAAGTTSYPTTGSFGVGCAADWSDARPPACGSSPPDGGGGPPLDAAPPPPDGGSGPPKDAAPPDAGGGAMDKAPMPDASGGADVAKPDTPPPPPADGSAGEGATSDAAGPAKDGAVDAAQDGPANEGPSADGRHGASTANPGCVCATGASGAAPVSGFALAVGCAFGLGLRRPRRSRSPTWAASQQPIRRR